MKMKPLITLILAGLLISTTAQASDKPDPNEVEHIRFAEHVVMSELVLGLSRSVQKARASCSAAYQKAGGYFETGALELTCSRFFGPVKT